MKYTLTLILLISSYALAGQGNKAKVEVDKDSGYVSINAVKSFRLLKFGCGIYNPDCHWDVYDLSGNKVLIITRGFYTDPYEITKANPQGTVWYARLSFLDSSWNGEFKGGWLKTEKWAKYIEQQALFKDGMLDGKTAKQYVLVHGTPITDRNRK
jgi:hypothetical protein